MQPTDTLEAQQQPLELIFPCKHALDGAKAFFENVRIEYPLGARLGFLPIAFVERNVRRHAEIEDGLTVSTAIIDAV